MRLGCAVAAGRLLLSCVNGARFAVGGLLGSMLTAAAIAGTVIAVHLVIAVIPLAVLTFFLRGSRLTPGGGSLH